MNRFIPLCQLTENIVIDSWHVQLSNSQLERLTVKIPEKRPEVNIDHNGFRKKAFNHVR